MANEVRSKEFVIQYNSLVIGRATDYSLEVNKEIIDVTTLDSEAWRQILAGNKNWKITFSGLVIRGTPPTGETNYAELLNDLKTNDDPVTVAIASTVSGDSYEEGQGLITQLSMSGATGDVQKYSGTIEGTSSLTTQTVAATKAKSK